MSHPDLLLRTKLSPPQRQRRVLARPALLARLREALEVRLTVVQAGTGYSKTTGQDAAADAAAVLPYIAAGITWWLEDLNPWRGPLEAMVARIQAGPPRL